MIVNLNIFICKLFKLNFILHDDVNLLLGTFEFSATKYVVRDDAPSVNVTIKRSNGHGGSVNLTLNTLNIDARDGIDYNGGELIFRLSDQVLK